MIYVLSPYSHPDLAVREHRFRMAEAFVAQRWAVDEPTFSPIVYRHALAHRHKLPTNAGFWAGVNYEFMTHASRCVLLALNGWGTSRGVAAELLWRADLKLPLELWRPAETEPPLFDRVPMPGFTRLTPAIWARTLIERSLG